MAGNRAAGNKESQCGLTRHPSTLGDRSISGALEACPPTAHTPPRGRPSPTNRLEAGQFLSSCGGVGGPQVDLFPNTPSPESSPGGNHPSLLAPPLSLECSSGNLKPTGFSACRWALTSHVMGLGPRSQECLQTASAIDAGLWADGQRLWARLRLPG